MTKESDVGHPSPRSRRYPSDVTNAEWQIIQSYVAPHEGSGAPRTVDIRAVVDALLYRLRTGCQWRMLPSDFPTWPTVYYYYRKWSDDGTWERIMAVLRGHIRRDTQPRAAPDDRCGDNEKSAGL